MNKQNNVQTLKTVSADTKNKKHYHMVDHSIVFLTRDANEAVMEIDLRVKEMFKGAKFFNPADNSTISAEQVCLDLEISENTGAFFIVVKANLPYPNPHDLEVKFHMCETTLHYINGEFAHVEEYKYSSGGGSNIRFFLPGETESIDFTNYVLNNL